MCQYEYAKYGACDHFVIDCREICSVALWRAGVTGDLIFCVPSILARSIQASANEEDEALQLNEFVAFSGSCNACIKELEIEDNVRQRDDFFGDITGSREHLSPDAIVYFQAEQLLTTFPHLLAIDQQLTQANLDLGPAVLFHEITEKFTWASLQKQQPYKISGFWANDEGMKPVTELLNTLQCTSGTSPQDRQMFVSVLLNNLDMKEFYKDVFRSRGMPYPMFSRLCAQIQSKAGSSRPQNGDGVPVVVPPQPVSSHPQPLSNPLHYVRPDLRSEDGDSAVSLSPARLQQASRQYSETSEPTFQALSGSRKPVAESPLQHQERSEQAAQAPRAPKRSFSTMQEGESTESSSSHGQSQSDQEPSGSRSQRRRYSRALGPSPATPNVSHVQAGSTASSSQLAMTTLGVPEATNNVSSQARSPAQSVLTPQQLASQRPVGHFDIAACRAMQVQARAAHAVPIQPLTEAVAQSQAALLQAAQARAEQPQPPQPQVQLVDATRAQILQAQYRRSQAPSEMQANRSRASQFEAGFNQLVQDRGFSAEAAQAGIVRSLKETQEGQVNENQANSITNTQSPMQQPPIDPSLSDQSAAIQSPSITSATQQLPSGLSATESTATLSSSAPQPTQSNMENIPGKGKGVLPHAVAKATFFADDNEKKSAIGHLSRAWDAYRRSSDASDVKERAAVWIVNFSLNFRQQWTLSARSRGAMGQTTLAQLLKSRSGVRSKNPGNPTSAAGAAQPQALQGQNVGGNQTAQHQL